MTGYGEKSWWRRAQQAGVDVATAMRRAAGFLARGGTDIVAGDRSRRAGEVVSDAAESHRLMAERRSRAAGEPTPEKALEIWVVCEQVGEGRWRATSIASSQLGVVRGYGTTAERCRGASFRYRLAHQIHAEHPHFDWEQARRMATRARICVAAEMRMK